MPRFPIDRATNFIVEDESWTVVEYDHTSVPGVIYLSLTENKINFIYDDVINDIADMDKMAKYEIQVPSNEQIFKLGDHINPTFTISKNGKPYEGEIELLTTNKKVINKIDNELIAVGYGTATIIAQLKDFPDIKKEIQVNISQETQEFSAYIKGPDSIKLNNEATYTLCSNSEIVETVTYSLEGSLATIKSSNNNLCIVRANEKNKLGEITLIASCNNKDFTKNIRIIPLW